MTTEQKHKIIDEVAVEFSLYPYQVEILKRISELDEQLEFITLARSNGRTMLKKAYCEMMNRIKEEELEWQNYIKC